jgi:predicted transcriptional regulator
MACINVDGTLTTSARRILEATREESTTAEIAEKVHIPLFRIRSSMRELVDAGFVTERQGKYQLSSMGADKLA